MTDTRIRALPALLLLLSALFFLSGTSALIYQVLWLRLLGLVEAGVPQGREMLAQLGARSFDDLPGMYIAGPDGLRRYVGAGPVLTDDRPMVEHFSRCQAIARQTCRRSREMCGGMWRCADAARVAVTLAGDQ